MNTNAHTVSPELRAWITEQLARGCRPEEMAQSMRRSGWSEAQILEAFAHPQPEAEGIPTDQQHPSRHSRANFQAPAQHGSRAAGGAEAQALANAMPEPELLRGSNAITVDGVKVDVLFQLKQPRVVLFGNLLSPEECKGLIELARPRLVRSETVIQATGGSEVNPARTSDGMFFDRGEAPLLARIEHRISQLVNWPVENGEGLQVLRYSPGAQYRPHHDYFDPAQPGSASVLRRGGQRVATLVIYLNTPARGGATTFPDAGLDVNPTAGSAVFFSYAHAHPSSGTLHGGEPVFEGEKWVATKWLRQRRFD